MTQLQFDGVRTRDLFVHGTFSPGTYYITGDRPETSSQLLAYACGLAEPERGRVTLDDIAPSGRPTLRRSIGAVLAKERLVVTGSVEHTVTALLALRGDRTTAHACLATLGAQTLLPRNANTLSADEQRAIALALALAIPEPKLLALHDPFGIQSVQRERVLERLRNCHSACVLLLVGDDWGESHLPKATRCRLEQGRLIQSAAVANPSRQTSGSAVLDIASSDAALLAQALADQPGVERVEFAGETLVVTTLDRRLFGDTLTRVALDHALQIYACMENAARTAPAQNSSPATPPNQPPHGGVPHADAATLGAPKESAPKNSAYSGYFPPEEDTAHMNPLDTPSRPGELP